MLYGLTKNMSGACFSSETGILTNSLNVSKVVFSLHTTQTFRLPEKENRKKPLMQYSNKSI